MEHRTSDIGIDISFGRNETFHFLSTAVPTDFTVHIALLLTWYEKAVFLGMWLSNVIVRTDEEMRLRNFSSQKLLTVLAILLYMPVV